MTEQRTIARWITFSTPIDADGARLLHLCVYLDDDSTRKFKFAHERDRKAFIDTLTVGDVWQDRLPSYQGWMF